MTKGSRPEQAVLTRDTDMGKTEETRRVIEGMVDGLNDHRIADIGEFFADGFRWMGNTGCGTKNNLKEFQDNWQKPFQVKCQQYMIYIVSSKTVPTWLFALLSASTHTNCKSWDVFEKFKKFATR